MTTEPMQRGFAEVAHESFLSNRLREKREHANEVRRVAREVNAATRAVNVALQLLTTNRYHESVPLDTVNSILTDFGFDPLESMILCGREGRLHQDVGHNRWLLLTWYKMESGRYEVVAYVS